MKPNRVFWIVITFLLLLFSVYKFILKLILKKYSEKPWKVRKLLVGFLKYILSGFHILSWPQSSIIQPNKCKSASHDDEVGIFFIENSVPALWYTYFHTLIKNLEVQTWFQTDSAFSKYKFAYRLSSFI